MSDPIWYRSLYFRIAFGFVALLATLLISATEVVADESEGFEVADELWSYQRGVPA